MLIVNTVFICFGVGLPLAWYWCHQRHRCHWSYIQCYLCHWWLQSILGTAEKYDIETDTWSDIAPMRTPRRNVGK